MPREAPASRVRLLRDEPADAAGEYVLYWMTGARRTRSTFALDHALARAARLEKPLLVLEPLEVDYPYASDRFHRFVLEGMREQRARFAAAGVGYHPYVEPRPGAATGLLPALAARAALVVADDTPAFFLPRILAAGARAVAARFEAVDSVGLLPFSASGKADATAQAFRARVRRNLGHVAASPARDPLRNPGVRRFRRFPEGVARRWPASDAALDDPAKAVAALPVDHGVGAVEGATGGHRAGAARLTRFLRRGLPVYADKPSLDADRGSRVSPYLHFGHLSSHEVFRAVAGEWSPARVREGVRLGSRGWWGLDEGREIFLDQLVTWRELSQHTARWLPRYDSYATLPEWAKRTLAKHAGDAREPQYGPAAIERAETGDALWNAAQRQLVRAGEIPNYLRMLWGKNILAWRPDPADAFRLALRLNDRYALDGRDPNSVSGVAWCFGRYDHGWPERPVFGKVRAMTSRATRAKMDTTGYEDAWS